MGGYFLESNNFIPADSLKTPPHIAPVWYFTPFYSMLRATTDPMVKIVLMIVVALRRRCSRSCAAASASGKIALAGARGRRRDSCAMAFDAKFWGVVVMGGAVMILFFLPWLDRSPVKSIRYRPGWHKVCLRRVRGRLPDPRLPRHAAAVARIDADCSQVGTLVYFGFFLLMPWWSRLGTFKPVPERVRLRRPLIASQENTK